MSPYAINQPVIYTIEYTKRNLKLIGISQNTLLIEPRWKSVSIFRFDLQTQIVKEYPKDTSLNKLQEDIEEYAKFLKIDKILDEVLTYKCKN